MKKLPHWGECEFFTLALIHTIVRTRMSECQFAHTSIYHDFIEFTLLDTRKHSLSLFRASTLTGYSHEHESDQH